MFLSFYLYISVQFSRAIFLLSLSLWFFQFYVVFKYRGKDHHTPSQQQQSTMMSRGSKYTMGANMSTLSNVDNCYGDHADDAECESFLEKDIQVSRGAHCSNPLSYFSFQPVLHDWCNKGRGMCYPVCGMVQIKEPLLLIDKSSLCGGSGFPFSLSEWSFAICLTPYNRR